MSLPGEKWLDAACGHGPLADLIGNRKQLIGLDIDAGCLQSAGLHSYQCIVQASVTDLPFADNSLDGIVSIETLEHVEEMSAALKEFSRCLKASGHLIVTMPAVTLRSWREMRRTGQPVYCSDEQHVRELSAIRLPGVTHRFQTFRWLENAFAEAGFAVQKSSGVGFLFPMWHGGFARLEHAMNILYREAVNRIFQHIPLVRRFPYYRMYLARRKNA